MLLARPTSHINNNGFVFGNWTCCGCWLLDKQHYSIRIWGGDRVLRIARARQIALSWSGSIPFCWHTLGIVQTFLLTLLGGSNGVHRWLINVVLNNTIFVRYGREDRFCLLDKQHYSIRIRGSDCLLRIARARQIALSWSGSIPFRRETLGIGGAFLLTLLGGSNGVHRWLAKVVFRHTILSWCRSILLSYFWEHKTQ